MDALQLHCNRFETKEINVEEKWAGNHKRSLTKNRGEGIVREVPRGLRNSKPPET
jgi:hypothetical protein